MKYIIVVGDGMADEPLEALSGKTPLAYARTPVMDRLSRNGEIGMVQTIPPGMSPGSDTANLAVLGYDPQIYYSGRSPLEALSIGVPMRDSDIAFRCNLVTLSEEEIPLEERRMIDHSADEISTADSGILLAAVQAALEERLRQAGCRLYPGISYRHCMIWEKGQVIPLTPPHDILGQRIGSYLPAEPLFKSLTEESLAVLAAHPINMKRREKGLHPANCCWFWGAGTKPALTSFYEMTGKKGMMVSAVDLLKGIAVGTGMGVAQVEGADGSLHTNYAGKVDAVCRALLREHYDFAYLHVEAPDEMSHQGSMERKIQAIEALDEKVIAPLVKQFAESKEPFRLLILPDHPTPVRLRTHTADSVPFLLYDSTVMTAKTWQYNEKDAAASGNYLAVGHKLIHKLLSDD